MEMNKEVMLEFCREDFKIAQQTSGKKQFRLKEFRM